MLLSLLVFCPPIAALLSLFSRKSLMLEWVAALGTCIEFVTGVLIAFKVIDSGHYHAGSYLAIDALSAIILLIVVTVGFATSIYSIGYLREEVTKGIIGFRRVRQYFVLFHLFLMTMLFAVSTTNPIMMWIAIEATTLSTAFLISFYNKPSAIEGAWKYLVINSVGLLLGFLGTLLFFTSVTKVSPHVFIQWKTLLANTVHLDPLVAKIAFIFVFIGYGTKVGFVPMHTWLPDAHSKAPAPISSLLSGVLLSVALLAILRFQMIVNKAIGPQFTSDVFILFGTFSIVISAFIIFIQNNYKRLLAYSSIEHMGIATLGFGFGGIGTFAALLHIIYHALTKSVLFFAAGNVLLKYSSTKIVKVRGVLSTLPITGILLMIGFLAITGIPPFGIFITKFFILSAGVSQHLVPMIIALLFLVLIFAGFLHRIAQMTFGEASQNLPKGEGHVLTILPPLVLICLFIFLGLFLPAPLKVLINSAVNLIQS